MTMTAKKLSETDIAALAIEVLESAALEKDEPIIFGREELVVTLPDHGQISLDTAYEILDMPDGYGVLEAKVSLSKDLVYQAMRWAGYVNFIWIAYVESGGNKPVMQFRRDLLDKAGVGRVVIVDGVATIKTVAKFQESDCKLFGKAYHAAPKGSDPKAGSATALRMTESRVEWLPVQRAILEQGCYTLKEIRLEVNNHKLTAQQIENAIGEQLLQGVICVRKGERIFLPAKEKK